MLERLVCCLFQRGLRDIQKYSEDIMKKQLEWIEDECNRDKEHSLSKESKRNSPEKREKKCSDRRFRTCFSGEHTDEGVICRFPNKRRDETLGLAIRMNTKESMDGETFWVRFFCFSRRGTKASDKLQ